MRSERIRRHLLSAIAMTAVAWAAAGADSRSPVTIDPRTELAMRLVGAHNQIRTAAAVQPQMWDAGLAASADAYALELAEVDKFAHSTADSRPGEGENLWRGTRGGFTIERMVMDWGSEKSMFRSGRFPNVSKTGRWEDVGHYTQIIWPDTMRVGCAVRASSKYDYLVCRYSSGGNVYGQNVGTSMLAAS